MWRCQISRTVQRKFSLSLLGAFLGVVLIPTISAYAGDKGNISYRAYTGFIPLVSGDANTGSTESIAGTTVVENFTFTGTATLTIPTQSYSDVYTGGIPFILEYAYRYNPRWTALAGIGFQYFPAKTFDAVLLSAAGTLTSPDGTTFTLTGAATIEGELDDMYRFPIYVGGRYDLLNAQAS